MTKRFIGLSSKDSTVQPRSSGSSVSVAMATYNGALFIEEQLRSLAAQTHPPLELVVSDDRSSDGTLDLIRLFAQTAPFEVRILPEHPRLGFSDNFLHAAEQCRGDYIAFCDQDDEWLPHKLETQLLRMQRDDSLLSLHRLVITDEALRPTGEIWDQGIGGDRVLAATEIDPYGTGWGNSMMFDRRLVHLLPRGERPRQPEKADLPLSHDHWIYTLAAGLGRVSHLMEPLLLYRQHASNAYGITAVPLYLRVRTVIAIPVSRLIAEEAFDRQLQSIFDEIGARHADLLSSARAAGQVYRQRANLCRFRLNAYRGDRIGHRLHAFRESRKIAFYTPSRRSSIKEAVFGVLGIGELLRPAVDRLFAGR